MKKIAIILSVLLCVILFNSCKDNDPETETNNTTESTALITELQNYTGKTANEVKATLESKGYVLYTNYTEDGVMVYVYLASNYSSMYLLCEAKNLICVTAYSTICDSKDTAYNYYEKYSAECNAKMKGKSYTYSADYTSINGEDSIWTNRQSFLSFYNEKKEYFASCEEDWMTETEDIGSIYDYEDGSINAIIMYMNTALTPPEFYENSKGKSFFNIPHINKFNISKK